MLYSGNFGQDPPTLLLDRPPGQSLLPRCRCVPFPFLVVEVVQRRCVHMLVVECALVAGHQSCAWRTAATQELQLLPLSSFSVQVRSVSMVIPKSRLVHDQPPPSPRPAWAVHHHPDLVQALDTAYLFEFGFIPPLSPFYA